MSGNVGNLPNVDNMDIQYAQSCILTPCDFPFARDGIAAEATENVETLTISDVNLADLTWARTESTVRNITDRRFDPYSLDFAQRTPGAGGAVQRTEERRGGSEWARTCRSRLLPYQYKKITKDMRQICVSKTTKQQ